MIKNMKNYRVSVKLIDVTHQEFESYMNGFCFTHKCRMEMLKDTYFCETTDEGFRDLEQIKEVFALKNKTIFINKGSI
jgi:hypothetical protein